MLHRISTGDSVSVTLANHSGYYKSAEYATHRAEQAKQANIHIRDKDGHLAGSHQRDIKSLLAETCAVGAAQAASPADIWVLCRLGSGWHLDVSMIVILNGRMIKC
jgi:hypothetical protein